MKKIILLLFTFISSLGAYAQIYQDGDDKGVLWVWPDQADSPSTVIEYSSNGIIIAPNGSDAQFQPSGGLGIGETLDISNDQILYVKAKGTGSPDLRIDLTNTDNFDTSNAGLTQSLSDEFEIVQFDFEGQFFDRWSAECSPNGDGANICETDNTIISGMNFFIDSQTGNYQGTVEIEWMSFGESLEDLVETSGFDVRYNNLGYTVDQQKLISIIGLDGTFSNKSYTITNSNGQIIDSGTSGDSKSWSPAGENAYSIDITDINTEGTYTFAIDEKSINFKVIADPYEEVRGEVFKYYYYNRASTEITAQYANEFARAAGTPDTQVLVHKSAADNDRPEGTQISSPGGWYDAGDYNKYIVNSGISTYTLLAAYEHYSNYFSETTFDIPETGGDLPDILDEAKYNLDWMLTMQHDYDGGVYHKLTGLNFSGSILPENYNSTRYVVKKSTSAALDFAAVMATASRVFAPYDAQYSATMLQAARNAYTWAKANPDVNYDQDTDALLDDVVTGEYEDLNFADEFQWAAVELYITTKEDTYSNDFETSSISGGVPGWQYVSPLALISILNNDDLPADMIADAQTNFLITANTLKTLTETSAMSVAMSGSDFVWGSNGVAGNQIMLLINAYQITEDESYLDAAYAAIDYMFGRNGTSFSFITGFGDLNPSDPHHRISEALNYGYSIPGMVVGGPHTSVERPLPGECDLSEYPSDQPAKAYVDGRCSYSTNEVTINWNAPMLYSLNALRAIQTNNTGSTLSNTDNYSEAFAEKFSVYPNPTLGELFVNSLSEKQEATTIEVFTLKGEMILSTIIEDTETSVDLSGTAPGIYLMSITIGDQSYATKIVKQ